MLHALCSGSRAAEQQRQKQREGQKSIGAASSLQSGRDEGRVDARLDSRRGRLPSRTSEKEERRIKHSPWTLHTRITVCAHALARQSRLQNDENCAFRPFFTMALQPGPGDKGECIMNWIPFASWQARLTYVLVSCARCSDCCVFYHLFRQPAFFLPQF